MSTTICKREGRLPVSIDAMDVSTTAVQQAHNAQVPFLACNVQRCCCARASMVSRDALREQVAHHIDMASFTGGMQHSIAIARDVDISSTL